MMVTDECDSLVHPRRQIRTCTRTHSHDFSSFSSPFSPSSSTSTTNNSTSHSSWLDAINKLEAQAHSNLDQLTLMHVLSQLLELLQASPCIPSTVTTQAGSFFPSDTAYAHIYTE